MRHRFVQVIAALLLVAALTGFVFAQSQGALWRVETAVYYISNGWIDEALEHLQQAVRISPDYAEARLLLGLLQHSLGDAEQALASYERLLELAPEAGIYSILIGDLYLAAGMLDEARAAYERAIRDFPDAGTAHYGLGRVLEHSDPKAAVESLTAAVEHAPDIVDARVRLGRLLRLSGDAEAALEHLLYASRLDRQEPVVRLELALVYEALERTAEAEQQFRMVLRLDPGNEEASNGLQRLLEAAQANT